MSEDEILAKIAELQKEISELEAKLPQTIQQSYWSYYKPSSLTVGWDTILKNSKNKKPTFKMID